MGQIWNQKDQPMASAQLRKVPGGGRPSGTDGSDFSYRMVVDSSKYTL
jgi:hypothetical protein